MGTTNIRTSLQRKREAFAKPSAWKVIGAPAEDVVPGLAEPSFLRSALDNATSAVRDEINATLAQATSQ